MLFVAAGVPAGEEVTGGVIDEEDDAAGVRVTALLPGGVDTGFWQGATARPMPVEDFLSAQQVADAVVTLAQMDDSVVPQELVLRALRDRDFAQADV